MDAVAFPVAGLAPVKCAWCGAFFPVRPGLECTGCGGPLPAPPGSGRGEPPPPAPRALPARFKQQAMLSRNVLAILGLSLVGLGLPLIAAFGFGLLFVGLGSWFWWTARKDAAERIGVLESGRAVEAELVSVSLDPSESSEGHYPFRIEYAFTVEGQRQVASVRSWDLASELRRPGEPLWALYDPARPEVSSLWPPHA